MKLVRYLERGKTKRLQLFAKALLGTGQQVVADPGGSLLAAQELVSSASRVLAPASTPLSPLWTKRSLGTRLVELSLDLSDLKAAAKAAGGTLNDAFVAGVIGALRSYHEEFGDLPDELRIHMPVNLRTADEAAQGGNHWIPARFPVPLNEADALERVGEGAVARKLRGRDRHARLQHGQRHG